VNLASPDMVTEEVVDVTNAHSSSSIGLLDSLRKHICAIHYRTKWLGAQVPFPNDDSVNGRGIEGYKLTLIYQTRSHMRWQTIFT
jgi:hypothetical protein